MNFYYISKFLFLYLIVYFLLMKLKIFLLNTRLESFYKGLFEQMGMYLKTNQPHMYFLFISLFMCLFFLNFISLQTNIFSMTMMSGVCVSLGLIFWVFCVLQNLMKNWKGLLTHLVPNNCPMALLSFMVFIETVSFLIRPITLSVRLMSNITSGHLLLFLMSKLFLASIFMILLELMVSVIQALVFSLLLTLYSNESNYQNLFYFSFSWSEGVAFVD